LGYSSVQNSRCFGIPCYTYSGLKDTVYVSSAYEVKHRVRLTVSKKVEI
jgi:hypothetical protein